MGVGPANYAWGLPLSHFSRSMFAVMSGTGVVDTIAWREAERHLRGCHVGVLTEDGEAWIPSGLRQSRVEGQRRQRGVTYLPHSTCYLSPRTLTVRAGIPGMG